MSLFKCGILALSTYIFLFICYPAFGAEEEIIVKVKADNLKYDEDVGLVVASGSVEAKLEDIIINADSMRVDVATNIVTAEGNVSLSASHYSAMGEYLVYNASTESASISKFYSIYRSPGINGEVFIRIEEFYDEPVLKWGLEGDVTTCDYDAPHYNVKAKRFEFYPEDKMVGYSVTFYINGVPVMWFPYWIYSFKGRRSSLMPVIGSNDVEGNFAKFGFDYFIDNDAYGVLYVDLMQKKGLGKGVEHGYRLNENNSGVFYVYHLEERDTGLTDWVTKIDHNIRVSEDTKVNLFHGFSDIYLVPVGRLDQTYMRAELDHDSDRRLITKFDFLDDRYGGYERYNLDASHRIDGFDTRLTSSFSKGKNAPRYIRSNYRLSHKQPLFNERITFSSIVNFSSNAASEESPFDERLEPQVEIVDREDDYTLRVFQNWYIDTDRDIFTGDRNHEYLEKQPEVTLSLKSRDMGWFTLNSAFGAARYREARYISETTDLREFTAERYNANFSGTRSIQMGFGSRLSLLGGVEQYLYSPGDARYVLREEVDLRTDLGGFFSNSARYKRSYSEGNTPFFFDIVGVNQENVSDTVTLYYQDKIRWVTSCGYNFRSDLYNDLITTLTVKPDPRLEGSASTGYDINNSIYRDLVLRAFVSPWEKISWTWDSVHDINNNLFKSANSRIAAEIGEDWRYKFKVEFRHSYDYFTGGFILRDLTFVKDLHCWETRFVYSDWRKEWRLSFTLKAFPEQPVGWGAGERGYFLEGFSTDKLLNDFRQPSPRRY